MKKLIAITGALALLALTAEAQSPTYGAVALADYSGIKTNIAGSTATNLNVTIDCRKQNTVALQITQAGSTAGTDLVHYWFQRSVDGSKWDAAGMNGLDIGIALAGTATVTTITNIPSQGCGWIRLSLATNAGAATLGVTNLSIKYAAKISAP